MLALPGKDGEQTMVPHALCPHCGTVVGSSDVTCPSCGAPLQPGQTQAFSPQPQGGQQAASGGGQVPTKLCPNCGARLHAAAPRCFRCGYSFSQPTPPASGQPGASAPTPAASPQAPSVSVPPGFAVSYIVPVAPRYASIDEEPGAAERYFRIGLGIVGYLVLFVVGSWLVGLLLGGLVAAISSPMHQNSEGFDPGTRAFPVVELIGFLLVPALIIPVAAWCIGRILRLVRDALHY